MATCGLKVMEKLNLFIHVNPWLMVFQDATWNTAFCVTPHNNDIGYYEQGLGIRDEMIEIVIVNVGSKSKWFQAKAVWCFDTWFVTS